uniref:Uncharacterized protein n=1 Tax=Chromera velia CCMP2878 TaxID=1169474 RepID=A0A0G4H7V0_9ALVE|eukprot:Cvel_5859.t1-p1 / transcript=Cvel_5859.t1 / gene=Cvel_5859 / organism=Chromera_velia_CCMP2878 / gene_product=hypothetical protein / transcript_product=hypothetical protein / location=Cvel_scaffold278:90008-92372(+) / protein_length=676 / sequence_SO=supercontig / SO=protein_coding / is_pseudo=false
MDDGDIVGLTEKAVLTFGGRCAKGGELLRNELGIDSLDFCRHACRAERCCTAATYHETSRQCSYFRRCKVETTQAADRWAIAFPNRGPCAREFVYGQPDFGAVFVSAVVAAAGWAMLFGLVLLPVLRRFLLRRRLKTKGVVVDCVLSNLREPERLDEEEERFDIGAFQKHQPCTLDVHFSVPVSGEGEGGGEGQLHLDVEMVCQSVSEEAFENIRNRVDLSRSQKRKGREIWQFTVPGKVITDPADPHRYWALQEEMQQPLCHDIIFFNLMSALIGSVLIVGGVILSFCLPPHPISPTSPQNLRDPHLLDGTTPVLAALVGLVLGLLAGTAFSVWMKGNPGELDGQYAFEAESRKRWARLMRKRGAGRDIPASFNYKYFDDGEGDSEYERDVEIERAEEEEESRAISSSSRAKDRGVSKKGKRKQGGGGKVDDNASPYGLPQKGLIPLDPRSNPLLVEGGRDAIITVPWEDEEQDDGTGLGAPLTGYAKVATSYADLPELAEQGVPADARDRYEPPPIGDMRGRGSNRASPRVSGSGPSDRGRAGRGGGMQFEEDLLPGHRRVSSDDYAQPGNARNRKKDAKGGRGNKGKEKSGGKGKRSSKQEGGGERGGTQSEINAMRAAEEKAKFSGDPLTPIQEPVAFKASMIGSPTKVADADKADKADKNFKRNAVPSRRG